MILAYFMSCFKRSLKIRPNLFHTRVSQFISFAKLVMAIYKFSQLYLVYSTWFNKTIARRISRDSWQEKTSIHRWCFYVGALFSLNHCKFESPIFAFWSSTPVPRGCLLYAALRFCISQSEREGESKEKSAFFLRSICADASALGINQRRCACSHSHVCLRW